MLTQKARFKRKFLSLRDEIGLVVNRSYREKRHISLCTSVKDRLEHLQQTFIKNIKDNDDYPFCEFVLLNYNCPDPDTVDWVKSELMTYVKSGVVSYYFFPDIPTFDRSHARNLAFRLSKGDIICNIDADNYVGQGFISYVSAMFDTEKSFLCGPRDGRSLGGRICVTRKDFEAVGGFDERIKSYGPEDLDLTKRLSLSGLQKRIIQNEKFCHVIQHSDELRTKYHGEDQSISSKHDLYFDIMNKNLSERNINPNGLIYGKGRVQRNFSEWIEI